jgi:plastocyanin
MTDTEITRAPQRYEIWILEAHRDEIHPELSTLKLELKGPFPLTGEPPVDVAQGEHAEFKPGDDITVNSGDTITWVIKVNEISSILILHKEKVKNVFSSFPAPVLPGTNWTGVVKKVSRKEDEEYYICWSQAGATYCYDPKITVNS